MSSLAFKTAQSLFYFSFLLSSSSLALLSLQPLWRLSDNQGRREEEGSGGKNGGRGGGEVRGSCDVPTQGYLILSVRGERLSPSVWLWKIKEAVQILVRSLALSS